MVAALNAYTLQYVRKSGLKGFQNWSLVKGKQQESFILLPALAGHWILIMQSDMVFIPLITKGGWLAGKKRHARRLLVIVCAISSNPPCCLTHVFRKDLGPWGKWNWNLSRGKNDKETMCTCQHFEEKMFNKSSSLYSVWGYCVVGCVAPTAASRLQLKTMEGLLWLSQLLAETSPAGSKYCRSNIIIIMQITHRLINVHGIYEQINP